MGHWIDIPTTPNLVMDILSDFGLNVTDIYSDRRRYTTYRKFVLPGEYNIAQHELIVEKIKGEMGRYGLPCHNIVIQFFESPTLGNYWGVCITNMVYNFPHFNNNNNKNRLRHGLLITNRMGW